MEPSAPLVPHRAPMLLIGSVLCAGAEHCTTLTRVDPAAWYADQGGAMPAWFGLELMAQTVAAHSGGQRQGPAAGFGYLLGTREYRSSVASFPAGDLLEVSVRLVYADPMGLRAFDCELRREGALLASATLKVIEERSRP